MAVEKYGFDEVRNRIKATAELSDDDMLMRLSYLGEQMCNHARTITRGHSTGGYDDQTGNLRSSIGYRILKDGEPVKDGGIKAVSGPKGNGGEGVTKASEALDNFSTSTKVSRKGWTLIIVAGMDYAQYVEDKGYNVLFLTGIELEQRISELKKKLGL